MGCLVEAKVACVGLVGTGKTGMDKAGSWGLVWIMRTDRQTELERARAGAAGNAQGSIALCAQPFPALSARAFHSLPPFPAFMTE